MADFGLCNVCEPGQPCICADVDSLLKEAESVRVISRGFKVGPDHFDVGPGQSLKDGVQLINVYYHATESGPDPELEHEPALTVGFTKEGAAKLMYTFIKAAKVHGWIEDNDE